MAYETSIWLLDSDLFLSTAFYAVGPNALNQPWFYFCECIDREQVSGA